MGYFPLAREEVTGSKGGETAPPEGPMRRPAPLQVRPPPPLTFMDVAEDMQPRLDAPLHRVEQLHAAHPLHLLGDPVQEAWQGRQQEGNDGAPAAALQSQRHGGPGPSLPGSPRPALPQPQGGEPGSSLHCLGPCGLIPHPTPHPPLPRLLPCRAAQRAHL